MADVIEIAEAVAGELSAFGAEVCLVPEYALRDVADRRVVVVPAGVTHTLITRGHHENGLKVHVGVLKRATEDELVDLIAFVEDLARGFLGKILCGSARCLKAEHVPLYVPEHFRERRQFTAVVELTFKEIEHAAYG